MSTQERKPLRDLLIRTDGGTSFSNDRTRILREILSALRRHPIVTDAFSHPPSTFTEVRATLAPNRWRHDIDSATLRVTGQPIDPPEFAFHYTDDGFDCGWHQEPNPHVDGESHYQERYIGDSYQYKRFNSMGKLPQS